MKRTGKIRFAKPDLKSSSANQLGEIVVESGTLLMDALLAAGIPVASSCRGDGVCTKCRLFVRELEPHATSAVSSRERDLLDRIHAETGERISCQTEVLGSIEVDAAYW